MKKEFSHFLITRFSIGSKIKYPDEDFRREWLRGRVETFEKFTLPSVTAQTEKNFKWLILFEPSIKDYHPDFIKRLDALGFCEPIYTDESFDDVGRLSKKLIMERKNKDIQHVITSRLDSDDAIHEDYIKDTQERFVPGETFFVNYSNGFAYSGGVFSSYMRNMVLFTSFYECLEHGELQTAYCRSHTALKHVAPVKHIPDMPMYIYAHHVGNISGNKFKMTSPFKLPLDYIALALCKRFDFFNKHLRYSYKLPVRSDDPRLKAFHLNI